MGCRGGTAWTALLRTEGAEGIPTEEEFMPASGLDAGPGNSAIYLQHAILRVRPMRTVSLMAANADFSKLVREVERGQGFLITRHGRPVARLVPHGADKADDPRWEAAHRHRRMMARLKQGASLGGLGVERVALHDR